MATVLVMPKQGNTVESCIIVEWKKTVGELVVDGDVLCEVETDKATLEVECTASGTLLALFHEEGDDVPVLAPIAAVGEPGEDVEAFRPEVVGANGHAVSSPKVPDSESDLVVTSPDHIPSVEELVKGISPRARNLASEEGINPSDLKGTGPGGRIIERDITRALSAQLPQHSLDRSPDRALPTPVAKRMLAKGEFSAPAQGSGVRGKITSKDLLPVAPGPEPVDVAISDEVEVIPLKGVRKVIAARMLDSLQTTAQLTLNASADARALLAYRQRLKASPEALALRQVTINDLVLFVVSRTLVQFPDLNALFTGDTIHQYKNVHLAFAVDTSRGLVVPVVRGANRLTLKQISLEAKRLSTACQDGRVAPDDLTGGTFTVSNMGVFGIETFTPILNPPQVGILGVGNVNLKPVQVGEEVQFSPHIGLSLTINHQVVDGAPGARFLGALAQNLAEIDLLLAI